MRGVVIEPGELLRSPVLLGGSLEERAVFLTLVLASYEFEGVLPAGDLALARIARCTPQEFEAVKPRIAREFDAQSVPQHWIYPAMRERVLAQKRWMGSASVRNRENAQKRYESRKKPLQSQLVAATRMQVAADGDGDYEGDSEGDSDSAPSVHAKQRPTTTTEDPLTLEFAAACKQEGFEAQLRRLHPSLEDDDMRELMTRTLTADNPRAYAMALAKVLADRRAESLRAAAAERERRVVNRARWSAVEPRMRELLADCGYELPKVETILPFLQEAWCEYGVTEEAQLVEWLHDCKATRPVTRAERHQRLKFLGFVSQASECVPDGKQSEPYISTDIASEDQS